MKNKLSLYFNKIINQNDDEDLDDLIFADEEWHTSER